MADRKQQDRYRHESSSRHSKNKSRKRKSDRSSFDDHRHERDTSMVQGPKRRKHSRERESNQHWNFHGKGQHAALGRPENKAVPPRRMQHEQGEESFRKFARTCSEKSSGEWDPDSLCIFLAQNQDSLIDMLNYHTENREVSDRLISLLHTAFVESSGLCHNSRWQMMDRLKTCAFFESRIIISIAKSLVSTRYRIPDESDTKVADQLLDIMKAMTESRVLPKEDTVVYLGSLQAALRSGRIVVKEEDLTKQLMGKAKSIERGPQEPLSSDNHRKSAELDFIETETDDLVPILPCIADIKTRRHTDLLPRNVSDPFKSATEYIRYVYLSFREDFIGPLCQGIRDYINFVRFQKKNPQEKKQRFWNQDVRLYENVRLLYTALSNDTDVDIVIQIDAKRFRNFISRLVYGSLVCLSCDEFQSVIYAVVSDRDLETLKKEGVLSVHILDVQRQVSDSKEVRRESHGFDETGNQTFFDAHGCSGINFPDRASGREHQSPEAIFSEEREQIVVGLLQGRSITMLESTAFYTAYVHSLEALKSMHCRLATRQSSLPFKKQLLQMSKDMSVPRYFEASSGQVSFKCMQRYAPDQGVRHLRQQLRQIKSDINRMSELQVSSANTESESEEYLGDLLDHAKKLEQKLREQEMLLTQKYCDNDINEPGTWPTAPELGLDDSQYAALRLALTHEVALIQGPPGTGKSTLGIRIAELLLENEHLWREDDSGLLEKTPFLLLSYTNHALDQFLTELLRLPVLQYDPYHHVIRVGSRSEEEILIEHNIAKLRQARRMDMVDLKNEKRQLDEIRSSRQRLDRQIQSYKDGIVHPDHLHEENAMPDPHYRNLVKKSEKSQMNPMLEWLCLDKQDFGQSLNHDKSYIHSSVLEAGVQENRRKGCHQRSGRQHKHDSSSTGQSTSGLSETKPENSPNVTVDVAESEEGEITDTRDGENPETSGNEAGKASVGEGELDTYEQEMDVELENERRLDLDDLSDEESEPTPNDQPETSSQHIDNDWDHFSSVKHGEETQTMLIRKVFEEHGSVIWTFPEKMAFQQRVAVKIEKEVSKDDIMKAEEADSVDDLWRLDINQRWRLYRLWLRRLLQPLQNQQQLDERAFRKVSRRVTELRLLTDLGIMKKARVVAMTTTGAARYAAVLRELGPRIILVEEAAQVTEAHLLSSLSPSCQHLIMIGDHQQLRPSYTNYDLTVRRGRHHIDISLFERLCRAEVPFQRLALQHRMRPEISSLLVPTIYSELNDHESVCVYPEVKGVKTSVFFLSHNQPEDCVEESRSKRNTHEAQLLTSLYLYLRLQGYSEKDITILAMYKDQVLLLRELIRKVEEDPRLPLPANQFFKEIRNRRGGSRQPAQRPMGARVTAVDNFQGEESRIILLSLVRSNSRGRIGYLREDNRVCVALSRAKEGLFVVGNCTMLSKASPDCWKPILEKAEKAGRLGTTLPLYCKGHECVTFVSLSKDIDENCRNGGCSMRCDYRRGCGHTCDEVCHSPTPFHRGPCMKPCVRKCPLGHPCHGRCNEWPCPPCQEKCEKKCAFDHPCQKTCGERCEPCEARCERKLPCGHRCQTRCGKLCTTECMELEKITGACGHEFQAACYTKHSGTASCKVNCGSLLECGHPCPGKCGTCFAGRLHVACKMECKRLLVCRHECQARCTQNCPPCRKQCEAKCVHSKQSCGNRRCGENCQQCMEPCKWRCKSRVCKNKYQCSKFCWEVCDRPRCDRPCVLLHTCRSCKQQYKCRGLYCEERCPPACPSCDSGIFDTFFGTEEEPDARFYQMPDCPCILEVSGLDTYMDMKLSSEGEVGPVVCPKCSSPVVTALRYGNVIKKVQADIEQVKRRLLATDPAQLRVKKFELRSCLSLFSPVTDNNEDVKKWKEVANRRVDRASTLAELTVLQNQINFLKAVSQLRQKLSARSSSQSKEWSGKLKQHLRCLEMWITGHPNQVFSQQQLTQFQAELGRVDLAVTFCVAVHQISTCFRSDAEKTEKRETVRKYLQRLQLDMTVLSEAEEGEMRKSIGVLKGWCSSTLGVTNEERIMIVKAMNFQKGHWYKCKNGHIYCIADCGGAMEESRCPECGEGVGGTRHRLRDDNAVATEMDGARYGAWSEQANMANYEL